MAKWVTFYWQISNVISDFKEHENKEEAETYFLSNYKNYFALNRNLKKNFKAPMTYGYAHRKFCVMTKNKFLKCFNNSSNGVINEQKRS